MSLKIQVQSFAKVKMTLILIFEDSDVNVKDFSEKAKRILSKLIRATKIFLGEI